MPEKSVKQRLDLEKDLKQKFLEFCFDEAAVLSESEQVVAHEIVNWFDKIAGEIDEIRNLENLSTLEQHFRVFLRQSPVLVFVTNAAGDVLFSEGKAIPFLGCPTGENSVSIFKWCEDKPWALEAIQDALTTSNITTGSGLFHDTRYEIHCAPLRSDLGSVTKILGLVIDATQRSKTEKLRDQQVAAMDASIDGMAIFNDDQQFTFLNDAHVKIYGYESREELLGKTWEVLYEKNELERFRKWIMPTLWSRGQWRGEAIGMRKDRTTFPQEVSLTKVRTGGLVCVVRDISERKRWERRKTFVSEYNAALAESMDYAETLDRVVRLTIPQFADYGILSLKGHREIVLACSQRSRETTNVDALEELKHYPFEDFSGALDIDTESSVSRHKIFRDLKINSGTSASLRIRGRAFGWVAFLRRQDHPEGKFDDTDRYLVDGMAYRAALAVENARLFREAREAVSLRENLMAAVSHDLKNPLTAISINCEILGRFTKAPLIGPHIKRIAKNLTVSVDRMGALIKQLLEFEKMRSGRLQLEKSTVDLDEVISEIDIVFQPLAQKKAIRFTTRLNSKTKSFFGDRDRLMQVLSNLIGNAIKFTGKSGQITLEIMDLPDELVFSVIDTGIGIPEQELDHVFELYWQSSGTAGQGSGLGLAIAKGIVEAHGGRIWAKSKAGRGSTFSFSIPLSRSGSRAAG